MATVSDWADERAGAAPLTIELELRGRVYPVAVEERQIFHEALEHALPEGERVGHRLVLRGPGGAAIYPDMFIGETVRHYGTTRFQVETEPLTGQPGPWCNLGFDHLAITVADREDARTFFRDVLGMTEVRHDPHLTVLTTGNTALFLFDAQEAPLSDPVPSRWHHLGFVVDDLEAAYWQLRQHQDRLSSDYTLLERDERWSLYCHYRNGDVNLMVQLSEIREGFRGFAEPRAFTDRMYDYLRGRYGVRFDEESS